MPGDTNHHNDVFVGDRQTGTTRRVSVSSDGQQANGYVHHWNVALSADGRYVGDGSPASNLVAGDTNGHPDVFVHDTESTTTRRVSLTSSGQELAAESHLTFGGPTMSADGRYTTFTTYAAADSTNGGTGNRWHVFVHDRDAAP